MATRTLRNSSVKGLVSGNSANEVVTIPLSQIEVDHNWNARSSREEDTTDDKGGGTRGWYGNLYSIARDGQRDPVTVRPNPRYGQGGKNVKPYSLVTGFGRARIAAGLASGAFIKDLTNPAKGGMTHAQALALKDDKGGSLRAIVKNLTEAEAIEENLGENVQRDSLAAPDLAVGIMRYRAANPGITDELVAIKFNRNQPYVSKIKRIAEGLADVTLPAGWNGKDSKAVNVLDAWRHDDIKLTQDDMVAIAQEKDASKRADLYVAKRKPKASGSGKGHTGPGAWILNAVERDVPVMAAMLIKLQRIGVISIEGGFDSKESIAAFLSPKRTLPEDATEEQIDRLSGAIERALSDAAKAAKEAAKAAGKAAAGATDESKADAAAKAASAPKGGKGGKRAAVNGASA